MPVFVRFPVLFTPPAVATLASALLVCACAPQEETASSSEGLVAQPSSASLFSSATKRVVVEVDYVKGAEPFVRRTAAFEDAYKNAPFVRITADELPEIKHVAHTNFCDVGWRVDEATGRVFVVSVLDNLVKGAAGQAIQNFNVMFGFDQKAGLL